MFELKDVKRAMEIVKNLDLPRDFGIDVDDDFDTYNIEEQISDVMNDSFFVTNGVSKMVIVPNELPFVIKIPFNGRWVSNFDCTEEEECEEFWYFMMAESRMSGDDYCARELELTVEIKAEGFRINIGSFAKESKLVVNKKAVNNRRDIRGRSSLQ